MTDEDIEQDLDDKVAILDWMIKYQIKTINTVGKVLLNIIATIRQ